MKILLLAALLFAPLAFSQEPRIDLPRCVNGQVQYQSPNHLYADFCINGLGLKSPKECREYQNKSNKRLLYKEMSEFINKRAAKVCGK